MHTQLPNVSVPAYGWHHMCHAYVYDMYDIYWYRWTNICSFSGSLLPETSYYDGIMLLGTEQSPHAGPALAVWHKQCKTAHIMMTPVEPKPTKTCEILSNTKLGIYIYLQETCLWLGTACYFIRFQDIFCVIFSCPENARKLIHRSSPRVLPLMLLNKSDMFNYWYRFMK